MLSVGPQLKCRNVRSHYQLTAAMASVKICLIQLSKWLISHTVQSLPINQSVAMWWMWVFTIWEKSRQTAQSAAITSETKSQLPVCTQQKEICKLSLTLMSHLLSRAFHIRAAPTRSSQEDESAVILINNHFSHLPNKTVKYLLL